MEKKKSTSKKKIFKSDFFLLHDLLLYNLFSDNLLFQKDNLEEELSDVLYEQRIVPKYLDVFF